jgi:hypothetical protein
MDEVNANPMNRGADSFKLLIISMQTHKVNANPNIRGRTFLFMNSDKITLIQNKK